MLRRFFYGNGKQLTENGVCIVPDNEVSTFTIQIRSLNSVDQDTLKRLIQQKYEVLNIEKTNSDVVIRESYKSN